MTSSERHVPEIATATPATGSGVDVETPCVSCAHPWSAHDALGVRYCTASAASAQSRGCICR